MVLLYIGLEEVWDFGIEMKRGHSTVNPQDWEKHKAIPGDREEGKREKETCSEIKLVFVQSSKMAKILLRMGWRTVCQKTTFFPWYEEMLPFSLNLSVSKP